MSSAPWHSTMWLGGNSKLSASCRGKEKQEWTACPMYRSFRRDDQEMGFCLSNVRVLREPGIFQIPESHWEQSIWVMCHCFRGPIVQEPKANLAQQPLPLPQEWRVHGICIQYSNFWGLLNGLVSVYLNLDTGRTHNTPGAWGCWEQQKSWASCCFRILVIKQMDTRGSKRLSSWRKKKSSKFL